MIYIHCYWSNLAQELPTPVGYRWYKRKFTDPPRNWRKDSQFFSAIPSYLPLLLFAAGQLVWTGFWTGIYCVQVFPFAFLT